MNIEKFVSNKATVECRYNAQQGRFRCHIIVGRRRIGPLHVRARDGEIDAAQAARQALARAVNRHEIAIEDLDHNDDGEIAVQAERVAGAVAASQRDRSVHEKRRAAAKPQKKERVVLGNGEETRALEKEYAAAKKTYHTLGEALRERHEVVAALEAGERRSV